MLPGLVEWWGLQRWRPWRCSRLCGVGQAPGGQRWRGGSRRCAQFSSGTGGTTRDLLSRRVSVWRRVSSDGGVVSGDRGHADVADVIGSPGVEAAEAAGWRRVEALSRGDRGIVVIAIVDVVDVAQPAVPVDHVEPVLRQAVLRIGLEGVDGGARGHLWTPMGHWRIG